MLQYFLLSSALIVVVGPQEYSAWLCAALRTLVAKVAYTVRQARLVGESDPHAERDAAYHQHRQVHCPRRQRGADAEGDAGHEHGGATAQARRGVRRDQAGQQPRDEQRRCEELQQLVVILRPEREQSLSAGVLLLYKAG